MQAYDKYKDSGIEWLGEIPEHWEVLRVKNIGTIKSGEAVTNSELVEGGKYEVFGGNGPIGYYHKFNVESQNIIIGRVGALCGNVRLIDERKWISDNALILSLHASKPYPYCYRILQTADLNKLNSSNAQPLITGSKVMNFQIPFPPLSEQETIAAFLDDKCGKIDEAVRIKRQQIEKLKELRQITIHNAVTKGLNPEAEMKDSGIKFLDRIPQHWSLGKFKIFLTIKARLGWKGLKADEYVDSSDYGFLSTPNIKSEEIAFENAYFITQHRYNESPEIMLEPLDVLLVKDGSTLGISNIIKYLPFKCTVNSSIAILRVLAKQTLNPFFLNYFLKGELIQRIISNMKGGMGVPHLFQADIKNFVLIIPPLAEQKEIVAYLDAQTSKIDQAITLKTEQIAKLNEYKQSLINDVVTGKIKVTN